MPSSFFRLSIFEISVYLKPASPAYAPVKTERTKSAPTAAASSMLAGGSLTR